MTTACSVFNPDKWGAEQTAKTKEIVSRNFYFNCSTKKDACTSAGRFYLYLLSCSSNDTTAFFFSKRIENVEGETYRFHPLVGIE